MKRTIALVLSLIFMLVLVPTTALAVNDVEARLEVTIPTATKTLFKYGTDLTLGWVTALLPEPLIVTLKDNTTENSGGTELKFGTAIDTVAKKYVLLINDKVYDPAVGYTFVSSDIGPKTLTVKYTYTPVGHSSAITVTADVKISVQNNVLKTLAATGPTLKAYFAGETLNLAGLAVTATYYNMTDPVTLTSDKYTVTATKAAGADPIAETAPLTTLMTQILVSRTETYEGSDEKVTADIAIPITVAAAATSMTISHTELNMYLTDSPVTVTAVPDDAVGSLVASVDKPAIASINTATLTSDGKVIVTPLSIGQAIVTVRARGSNISQSVVVNVKKTPVPETSITLDKNSLLLPVNGTYSLSATVGPDDADDKSITWTSSSTSNVSVDSTGTIKVIRDFSKDTPGAEVFNDINGNYVKITATTALPLTSVCKVYVNTVAVDGISLSETSITLYKESYKTISAIVTPTGAADSSIAWSSSDPSIATVDSTGKITAKGLLTGKDYGDAIITAQTSNSSIRGTVTVHVLPAVLTTSLTLNKSDLALNVGDAETLTVTGSPSNATNKTLIWTSSNTDVASVTSAGKVTANAKGTAVITATSTDGSGKKVTCVVTVNNIQILNISLDKSSFDLSEGDTAAVKATIYPTNASNQTLKWTSSNTSVATVDGKGNITAGSTKGYAIITAAATDGSGKSAECVVLSKPKIAITGLTINYGTALDLMLGDATYLKATILPANATTQTVTWASSDTSVATVDSTGLLKGVKLGEATITATGDGKTVSIKITVTNTEYNYGVAANFRRRVNVRANASGLSKLVGYAYLGDTFKILGKTGSWYYIQYNNTTKGYIWASYLNATKTSASYTLASTTTLAPGATATPATSTTPTKVTIANCLYAVNVRASASTSSTRVGKASLGVTYTYLGTDGDWYKIQYNTTTVGYVFKTFATLS
ncbi:MAG: Ig-like domain-containing protein [Eubacteriales bacterium]|nr:Ig-like domain-containing protein [Eubacteriales bacterium]